MISSAGLFPMPVPLPFSQRGSPITPLSSPEYLAEPETNGGFILKHSVGNYNKNSEVDVPLSYADYYYVEALLRLKKLQNEN